MNREQRWDPFLLDKILEERRLVCLCNVFESEPEEPVVWIPGELLRFLGRGSKGLVLYRKAGNGDNIGGYNT